MAANQRPVANPVYENFEPSTEWSREPTADVLVIYLPGFKKEQLKVQVTSTSQLRISGERPIDVNKRSRFVKEQQIPFNCNTNEISAKFEGGILSIRLPKNISPAETQKPKPTVEAPKPQQQITKQDLKPKPTAESPKPQQQPPKQDAKPKPKPTESRIPQQQPQEKVQPPRESVPTPANDQTPQAPKNNKQEEAVVQEKVPEASIEKPKIEKVVPNKAAEEKKESPSDKHKSSVVDSINNNIPAEMDKTTGGIVSGSGMPALVPNNYKQVLRGLMLETKKPKKLTNLVVVVLLIVMIVLSANSAIRYLLKFNTTEASSSEYQA